MSTAIFNNINVTGLLSGVRALFTGSSDAIQLKVKGNATQTTNPFQIVTSADANILSVSNDGVITPIDGGNFVLGATTGTKFGTATTQKLAFYNSTPIVQPANTVAIDDVLINTGLRATGGVANFATTLTPRTGSTAAGTAPLKFTSGGLLSATEAGAVEFNSDDYYATITTGAGGNQSYYPPGQSDAYVKATSKYSTNYWPYFATDPTKSLIGTTLNSWLSSTNTNQAFHIDLGSAKSINRIYYENSHYAGLYTNQGARNFTLWGSNTGSAFADTTYATDTNWVQITAGLSQTSFDQHVNLNVPDPKYITLTTTTAYRYYRIKIAGNYGDVDTLGLRRIELQDTTQLNGREKFVLTNGEVSLTSGRVPFATTNGRLTDDADMTFSGSRLTVTDLTSTNAPIVSSLTAGRVLFAGASKEIVDDADFTFATDTLTVTKIAATQFTGDVTIADTKNIILNTTTGTKIGTETAQKLGFWNVTPVVQQAHIADPTGGLVTDAEARTAITSINALLATLGLTAAS